MQKIKFNNNDRIFDVMLNACGNNRIKCLFHSAIDIKKDQFLKSGFKELNEKNLRVQGNHSKMRYFYQVVDSNTIIYTSIPDDTYENEQEKMIEKNRSINTIQITAEENKKNKIKELSEKCHSAIVEGVVIIINGKTEHFTYNDDDQKNIKELYDISLSTNSSVYYHAENMGYEEYTAEQMYEIYFKLVKNKMHHLTYYNQLKMYVESLTNNEEISKVYYGQKLTDKYLDTYNNAMKQNTSNMIEYEINNVCTNDG